MMRDRGIVHDMTMKLAVTSVEAEFTISYRFELWKLNESSVLRGTRPDTVILRLSFNRSRGATFDLHFTLGDARQAYEDVLVGNILLIQRQLEAVPTEAQVSIEVTGGFGRCQYFIDRIREAVSTNKISVRGYVESELAVANGAVLRYLNPKLDSLPWTVKFGVVWDEPFDPEGHPDAVTDPTRVVTSSSSPGSGKENKEEDRVEYRLKWIFSEKHRVRGSHLQYMPVWQWHAVPLQEANPITLTVYCTEEDIKDHAALADHVGGEAPSVHEWTTLEMPVDQIKSRDFPIGRAANGARSYIVYTQMVIRADGTNVEFGWRFVSKAEYDKQDEVLPEDVASAWAGIETRERLVSDGIVPFTDDNVY